MRLIDADELQERLPIRMAHYDKEHGNEKFVMGIECAMEYLDEMPTVDAVPVCVLKEILMRYFDIGDSYHFELTRVKEAFEVGTMSLDDFQEWTEENVDDLADYIKKNCADGERKGGTSE